MVLGLRFGGLQSPCAAPCVPQEENETGDRDSPDRTGTETGQGTGQEPGSGNGEQRSFGEPGWRAFAVEAVEDVGVVVEVGRRRCETRPGRVLKKPQCDAEVATAGNGFASMAMQQSCGAGMPVPVMPLLRFGGVVAKSWRAL